jgi:hypothetical protein
MKRFTRALPLLLAAGLQLLPLLRNIVTAPAATSSFAIILRWTIGSSAALGAFDACSGASNYFTSTNIFTGTVGVRFTNNLTLLSSGSGSGAATTLTTNGISAFLTVNGQTTNFAMPAGLIMKFVDVDPIYDAIYGTPTTIGTNSFTITLSYPGQTSVTTNITIRITALVASPPVITNQPASLTNVAGGNATFTVTAGTAPLSYRWFFNTNTSLLNATNTSLSLTNVRASQAGKYSVIVTNSSGSVTSAFATLTVTNPLPTALSTPTNSGGVFRFTFIPTMGLTNSVQTNSGLTGGVWAVLTNVPPPATAAPVTVTDALGSSNRFYRVAIQP